MSNLIKNPGAELSQPPPDLTDNASLVEPAIGANTGTWAFNIPWINITILGSPFKRRGSISWPNLPLVVGYEYTISFYILFPSTNSGTHTLNVEFDDGVSGLTNVGSFSTDDYAQDAWINITLDPITAEGNWGELRIGTGYPNTGESGSFLIDDVVLGATMAVVVSGTQYSPSNRTFSSLKTEVARYILADTDTEALAQAGEGLNEAARRLNSRAWHWMNSYYDVTLVAGTADYAMPITMKDPRHVERLNTSGKPAGKIGIKDMKSFLDEHSYSEENGTPTVLTVMNSNNLNQITLDYAPDTTFVASYPTLRVWFYGRVEIASNDNDTYAVPSEVENFMLWSAKAYLASSRAPERWQAAEGKAERVWRELIKDDVQTGHRGWVSDYTEYQ